MFQSLFCGFKTGTMRRLPYFGYTALLFTIAILLIVVLRILSSPGLEIIRFIAIIPIIVLEFAILYSSVVMSAKRLRNIGIERAKLYSLLILGGAIFMEIIIAFFHEHAVALTAIYYTLCLIIEIFLIFTPENYIKGSRAK